jgi:hypothetical protein
VSERRRQHGQPIALNVELAEVRQLAHLQRQLDLEHSVRLSSGTDYCKLGRLVIETFFTLNANELALGQALQVPWQSFSFRTGRFSKQSSVPEMTYVSWVVRLLKHFLHLTQTS